MAKNVKTTNNEKGRNWTFIVYPESAPENWQDILFETGCKIAISPLHDKDINANGEMKKPHYHIILIYGNSTTFKNIKGLCDKLNSPIPKKVMGVTGLVRYLTHKDNPEKAQYNEKDIITLNGFEIEKYDVISISETYEIKKQIINYIIDNHIGDYIILLKDLMDLNYTWFKIAIDNTILFTNVCNSNWKVLNSEKFTFCHTVTKDVTKNE